MSTNKQIEHLSKLAFIFSLIGLFLILIPILLISFMYAYDNKVDPGILMLIGIILLTLSIPMAIVVILLYIFTLGASITGLYKGVSKTLNMITLIISILAIIISIIGTYHYFDTTIELIDTISRLG